MLRGDGSESTITNPRRPCPRPCRALGAASGSCWRLGPSALTGRGPVSPGPRPRAEGPARAPLPPAPLPPGARAAAGPGRRRSCRLAAPDGRLVAAAEDEAAAEDGAGGRRPCCCRRRGARRRQVGAGAARVLPTAGPGRAGLGRRPRGWASGSRQVAPGGRPPTRRRCGRGAPARRGPAGLRAARGRGRGRAAGAADGGRCRAASPLPSPAARLSLRASGLEGRGPAGRAGGEAGRRLGRG